MGDNRKNRIIWTGLLIGGVLVCLIAVLAFWNPVVGTRLNPIQYFLVEDRWSSRGEFGLAGLPVTAYEIAPGGGDWGNVTARYYYSELDSGSGEEVHAQFSSPQRGELASLAMSTPGTNAGRIEPFLGDTRVTIALQPSCGPVDITWANDAQQCTCTIDDWIGSCLTWWKDRALFVIISTTLHSDELQDFANSLTPVKQ